MEPQHGAKDLWVATVLGPEGVSSEKFSDLDDAIYWQNQAIVMQARGEPLPIRHEEVLFADFADGWLQARYSSGRSRKGTYASQLKRHVLPYLGKKDIREISTSHIEDWLEALKALGVGTATINSACTIVRQVFKHATKKKILTRTPWVGIVVPSPRKSKRARAFSVEELLGIAVKCGPYELLVMVLGMCGLRIGEATALQKKDLDFRGGVIMVENAWKKTETGKRYLGEPKNGDPREVPIPETLRESLAQHCESLGEDGFLFVGDKGSPLNSDFFRKKWFIPALTSLGIRNAGIHMLRHTCASLLIRLGTPITTVSQILGHSNVEITLNTYSHFYVEDSFAAMAKLSQLIESYTE